VLLLITTSIVKGSGALLIGQDCPDLASLGFNDSNSVIFTEETFETKARDCLKNPEKYLEIRKNGQELIRQRHLVSHRIDKLRELWGLQEC